MNNFLLLNHRTILSQDINIDEKGMLSMKVTYIHHSGFLVETKRNYYLFDYESGEIPTLEIDKPIYVLSSHSHSDHYNPDIFKILNNLEMKHIKAILSDDIETPKNVDTLHVLANQCYELAMNLKLTTYKSTDLGVAFLLEEDGTLIYHAGDLNDWIWEEESEAYNQQMTIDYRHEIQQLSKDLNHREIDVAFVVLDPRQEQDYARGICYFMEHITSKVVYPMHYWNQPEIIDTFLNIV